MKASLACACIRNEDVLTCIRLNLSTRYFSRLLSHQHSETYLARKAIIVIRLKSHGVYFLRHLLKSKLA